ncbi:hypothetical protein LAZ67_21000077 [Cordylochernes scorpioides]|uniref:Integrase catalytic domain-containing protein n=1 Tax=Cordylochernes scorpioides TaxID=51811 RepID=A0ABY6LL68_9ARAC|nr:hypothetical protein LAZ67_21000077 [Cordylochernes scorpioides]
MVKDFSVKLLLRLKPLQEQMAEVRIQADNSQLPRSLQERHESSQSNDHLTIERRLQEAIEAASSTSIAKPIPDSASYSTMINHELNIAAQSVKRGPHLESGPLHGEVLMEGFQRRGRQTESPAGVVVKKGDEIAAGLPGVCAPRRHGSRGGRSLSGDNGTCSKENGGDDRRGKLVTGSGLQDRVNQQEENGAKKDEEEPTRGAMKIEDIFSKTIIKKLMYIFARHGYPHEDVTDNGLQFVSASMKIFLKNVESGTSKPHPINQKNFNVLLNYFKQIYRKDSSIPIIFKRNQD